MKRAAPPCGYLEGCRSEPGSLGACWVTARHVRAVEQWLRATRAVWPPPRARWLKSDAVTEFRESYLNYRGGNAKGARGEIEAVPAGTVKRKKRGAARRGEDLSGDGYGNRETSTEEEIRVTSIFEDAEDPKTISLLTRLEKFRRAYRQFRCGSSRGAEGELSGLAASLSRDDLRLLPVAALASCLVERVKGFIEPPQPTFHVHLGGGRLGFGLILPAMTESKVPFAIIQRPSEEWSPVTESANPAIEWSVNGEVKGSLRVIRSLEDLLATGFVLPTAPATTNSAAASGADNSKLVASQLEFRPPRPYSPEVVNCRLLLLLPPDSPALVPILSAADSFSCALGSGLIPTLRQLAAQLPPHSGLHRPALYACENDHHAVDETREFLDAPLAVRECMVDRICSARKIDSSRVAVLAEPFEGQIVVTARHTSSVKPAFAGKNVFLPRTPAAYSYLYNRKFLLVNGTHTTLAFMTLRESSCDPALAPGDFELLDPECMAPELRVELDCWVAARCLILLHGHGLAIIKHTHNVTDDHAVVDELWQYARNILRRFSSVKDSTKRVLGAGIANKFESRLKEVLQTVNVFAESLPLRNEVLERVGVKSVTNLREILQRLVSQSECYVTSGKTSLEPGAAVADRSTYIGGYQQQLKRH